MNDNVYPTANGLMIGRSRKKTRDNLLPPQKYIVSPSVLISDGSKMYWDSEVTDPAEFTYIGYPANAIAAGYSGKVVCVTGTPIGAGSMNVLAKVP